MKKLLLVLIVLLSLSTASDAATFYVANNGDDSRSNGQAQSRFSPWRTIQRAVDQANGGDEVVVLAGTYFEHVSVRRSGFPGNDIVIRSEVREGARVIGSISVDDQAYITISDFDLSNHGGSLNTKGIAFNRCHHATVRNNLVRECFGGGIAFDQTDWILCEFNVAHSNAFNDPAQHSGISVYQPQYRGNDSRQFGVIIRNNISFANQNFVPNILFGVITDGNGIVCDDYFNTQEPFGNGVRYDRPTLIENNLCFDNGGNGIHCFLAQNINIRNNTCINNVGSFDFGGEVSVSESERVYVYNNVFQARPGRAAGLQFASQEAIFFLNIFNGPLRSLSLDQSNSVGVTTFRPFSFELEPFSPAVNQGFNAGNHFPFDVFGRPRFNGQIDFGALEVQ